MQDRGRRHGGARAGMDMYPWMVSDTTYDADREMLAYWRAQGLVTEDPCTAQLFYVPVFSADYCQVGLLALALLVGAVRLQR